MHDAITAGAQLLAIFFGVLFNQRAINKLDVRFEARFNGIDGHFNRIESRLDRMEADLSMIGRILSQQAAHIENLKRNRPT